MALKKAIQNFRNELGEEIKEVGSLLRRIGSNTGGKSLGANFRKYGASFGIYDFDDYVRLAKRFFEEAMRSADGSYIIVDLPGNRVAIDYNSEMRGIYTAKGKPLAFFRPDFRQLGYNSKADELAAFSSGNNVLFS